MARIWTYIDDEDLKTIDPSSNLHKRAAANMREQASPVWEQFIASASSKGSDGELEVDDDAAVSLSEDDGAYVMGWVWVYRSETKITKKAFRQAMDQAIEP